MLLDYVDSLSDWIRLIMFGLCFYNLTYLILMFSWWRQEWNAKTRDYWFVLTLWTLTGTVGSIEGVLRDVEGGYRVSFALAATLATTVGLSRKGPWGSGSAEDVQ